MIDLACGALLGFAIGLIVQEIHFRKISNDLDELSRRIAKLSSEDRE